MELKAIEKKLQLLKAETTAANAVAEPWSAPRQSTQAVASPSKRVVASEKTTPNPKNDRAARPPAAANNTLAIKALQQRSQGGEQAINARADQLVAQEIYRLEVQADIINQRSHQQSTDIAALKRAAQQAAVALRRQGIQAHPKLAAITQFFEAYQSAVVPHIERDSQGHFALTYDTIDFHQAEREAQETAHSLRQRAPQPFAHPIAPGPALTAIDDPLETAPNASPHQPNTHSWLTLTIQRFKQRWGPSRRRSRFSTEKAEVTSEGATHTESTEPSLTADSHSLWASEWNTAPDEPEIYAPNFSEAIAPPDWDGTRPSGAFSWHQFSWLDGTIWFSGGAIIRVAATMAGASNPLLVNFLWLVIASIIAFALYRVVFSRSSDYGIVYKLLIAMLGLLMTSFLF